MNYSYSYILIIDTNHHACAGRAAVALGRCAMPRWVGGCCRLVGTVAARLGLLYSTSAKQHAYGGFVLSVSVEHHRPARTVTCRRFRLTVKSAWRLELLMLIQNYQNNNNPSNKSRFRSRSGVAECQNMPLCWLKSSSRERRKYRTLTCAVQSYSRLCQQCPDFFTSIV